MNLYLISQTVNKEYDTYDSAVVAAVSEDDARSMPPYGHNIRWSDGLLRYWASPKYVHVTYLGKADDKVNLGVVCASFNAG